MNRDFKGVWIPKDIWLSESLSIIEKCLITEIDSLDNDDEKGCFASNEYLGKFLGKSESRVANMICDLKKRGFIQQVYWNGRERGLRIKSLYGFSKVVTQPYQKRESSFTENGKADLPDSVTQPYQKREHINTVNNTLINTVTNEAPKSNFKDSINSSPVTAKNWGKMWATEFDLVFKELQGVSPPLSFQFAKKDFGTLSQIKRKLLKLYFDKKGKQDGKPSEQILLDAFKWLLGKARLDKWIANNWSVQNINSQFNAIVALKVDKSKSQQKAEQFDSYFKNRYGDE